MFSLRRIPVVTGILIIINLYLAYLMSQHNFDVHQLLLWGGSSRQAPTTQPWSAFPGLVSISGSISGTELTIVRGIYASFLHVSWEHVLSNILALYFAGLLFERDNYFGMLLPVYLITGVVSMVAAGHFSPATVTVGASGAIFGIMGAMLTLAGKAWFYNHSGLIGYNEANAYFQAGYGVFGLVIYNLISTFIVPGISIYGHIFGLVSGIILGLIIPMRKGQHDEEGNYY